MGNRWEPSYLDLEDELIPLSKKKKASQVYISLRLVS